MAEASTTILQIPFTKELAALLGPERQAAEKPGN